MDRARRAVITALVMVSAAATLAVAASGSPPPVPVVNAAAPTWPASTLVISEVMTGGASASDEFVELFNASGATVDLVGLELAYVTSTGSTVTRKGTWAVTQPLGPGQHLLLANTAGIFAVAADVSYSGGFAATGGALVLRPIGGAPIDAVGWGDATNAFVETLAMPAPPAGSSGERLPGGAFGNGTDTNNNASDFLVQGAPNPQNLAAAPIPIGSPTPSPTSPPPPSATPSPTPTSTASAPPSPTPIPTPPPSPTPSPTPSLPPSGSPTPTPTPPPTPTPSPSPSPSVEPSEPPSPSPSVAPSGSPLPSGEALTPISIARTLPDDTTVRIAGTLTTTLGALETGRGGFVEDAGGGIALYLAAVVTATWTPGTTIEVSGVLDDRFAQRTLRIDEADIVITGTAALPQPLVAGTGTAGESLEGRRLSATGTTVGSPSTLTDGTAVTIDDGSGPLRVVIGPPALGGASLPSGTRIAVIGPLGQRDSSGTGVEGYRLHATEPGDLVVFEPPPTPTPTPTPSPSSTPAPTPSPAPTPTPGPTASPTPGPSAAPIPIATARDRAVGSGVTVEGVVTAEAGRLGTPALVAIEDPSAGIAVKLPEGFPRPPRGTVLRITGPLADPYGQLEIRPSADDLVVVGTRDLPPAGEIDGAQLGETTEGQLVTLAGTLDGSVRRATSGDISLDLVTADGTSVRVLADASSGLTRESFATGASYRIVGIAGQRASRKGLLDGYRIWLRDAGDRTVTAQPPGPGASNAPAGSSPGGSADPLTIAQALLVREGPVSIQGTVTAEVTLLDSSGRRIVVEDATAAVEVLLPQAAPPPSVGTRLAVTGTMGRAYGAPRLKATDVRVIGSGPPRRPLELRSAPGPAHEWRLVRISGRVVDLRRLGGTWRAEMQVGAVQVPVSGLAGAEIPSSALAEGRSVTVTGIVKRPHPSATDRRYAIVPRGPADLAVGPAGGESGATAASGPGAGTGSGSGNGGAPFRGPTDIDLVDLEAHVGRTVRVGGLIVDLVADGFALDDGTAVATVVLLDGAAEFLPLLEPGDAINATGRIERRGDAVVVVVRDPAGLARVGDLDSVGAAASSEPSSPSPLHGPLAASTTPLGLDGPSAVGIVTLMLLSTASAAVTLVRRRQLRRRLLARVTARLAAIQSPGPTGDGRPTAGHGPSDRA